VWPFDEGSNGLSNGTTTDDLERRSFFRKLRWPCNPFFADSVDIPLAGLYKLYSGCSFQ